MVRCTVHVRYAQFALELSCAWRRVASLRADWLLGRRSCRRADEHQGGWSWFESRGRGAQLQNCKGALGPSAGICCVASRLGSFIRDLRRKECVRTLNPVPPRCVPNATKRCVYVRRRRLTVSCEWRTRASLFVCNHLICNLGRQLSVPKDFIPAEPASGFDSRCFTLRIRGEKSGELKSKALFHLYANQTLYECH